jgi:hypothetical protein
MNCVLLHQRREPDVPLPRFLHSRQRTVGDSSHCSVGLGRSICVGWGHPIQFIARTWASSFARTSRQLEERRRTRTNGSIRSRQRWVQTAPCNAPSRGRSQASGQRAPVDLHLSGPPCVDRSPESPPDPLVFAWPIILIKRPRDGIALIPSI